MRDIGIYKFNGWEEDPTKVTKETIFKPIYTKNVLEFSEELRAQFVEQCDLSSYKAYDLENAEILNILRDKWYIVYVPYLLPYGNINHYFNGFTYQQIGNVYFEYYKEYTGLLILWSPDKSFGSEKWLHSYEYYMRWVYSSPVVEILTSEEIESISWPKYKESELPNNPNYIGEINDEMKNELSSKLYTYLEEKGKNIEGFYAHDDITYCGTYDDVVLFYGYDPTFVTATFDSHVYYERIDDRVLVYSNSKNERIYAYKDGKVYTLKEAYDEGIINYESICKIPDTVYTYYEKALLNDSYNVHWI